MKSIASYFAIKRKHFPIFLSSHQFYENVHCTLYTLHTEHIPLNIWRKLLYDIYVHFKYKFNIENRFCIFQDSSYTNRKIYKKRIRSEADFYVILIHIFYESDNLNYTFWDIFRGGFFHSVLFYKIT